MSMTTSSTTRRSFLLSGAAALTTATLAAAPTARSPRSWQPKKAVKIGMVHLKGSLADKFAAVKQCGFDGIELDCPSDVPRDEALLAMRETGLVIHGLVDSVHWQKPLSAPEPEVRQAGREALTTALREAKALGATSVLLVPAVVQKHVPYLDAWQRSQEEIKKVLPFAEELGVDVLIENVWNKFLLGPTELARYVDELGSERVGCYFDPGNLVHFGWPEHWVPILGARIKKVDVKDYVRGKAGYEGFGVALNDGHADWPAIVSALRAVGYDGWFTAEMAGGGVEHLSDLARRMDVFLKA
jgi:L-ribulose-5-phosphate 3-epimerase